MVGRTAECSHEGSEGAKFCTTCGQALAGTPIVQVSAPPDDRDASRPEEHLITMSLPSITQYPVKPVSLHDMGDAEYQGAVAELGALMGFTQTEIHKSVAETGARSDYEKCKVLADKAFDMTVNPEAFGLTHAELDRRKAVLENAGLRDGALAGLSASWGEDGSLHLIGDEGDLAGYVGTAGSAPAGTFGTPSDFVRPRYGSDPDAFALSGSNSDVLALTADAESEVAALIDRHGGEFGFTSDDGGAFGLASGSGYGTGDAEDILRRNEHILRNSSVPRQGSQHLPVRAEHMPGAPKHTHGRNHSPRCPATCTRDHKQPARSQRFVNPEVERISAAHPELFGAPEADTASNNSYPPGQLAAGARRY